MSFFLSQIALLDTWQLTFVDLSTGTFFDGFMQPWPFSVNFLQVFDKQ
jgi:hypothetical protein